MDVVKGPVEATFPVHVLAVLPLDQDVDVSDLVTFNFLVLGRVKISKSHDCNLSFC